MVNLLALENLILSGLRGPFFWETESVIDIKVTSYCYKDKKLVSSIIFTMRGYIKKQPITTW